MKLSSLVSLLEQSPLEVRFHCSSGEDAASVEISSLVSDSRVVTAGSLFACVPGDHTDGHGFAGAAVRSGAAALLCEYPLDLEIPQIICPDVRRSMGRVASILYGEPSSKLLMVAVTGTNGKTTSSFMIRSILESSGIKTGILGTVLCGDGLRREDSEHTTPEGSDLQRWLYRMLNNGCKACVMEASSHSISQGRLEGALFDRAGFTNLTVDHLNYHQDMESYYRAKKVLFERYMKKEMYAAVNSDDEYGRRIAGELGARCCRYGMADRTADFYASVEGLSIEGTDVRLISPYSSGERRLRIPLLGTYNVMNALQALSLCWSMDVPYEAAAEGLLKMDQVPGRLERYLIEGSGTCVIDFAHNPDGLKKILTALRSVCAGKISVVFGAGGESDRSKRPIMGEVASSLADLVIISSDNPKSEDPLAIAGEIEMGASKYPTERKIITEREEAVGFGLERLMPGDILLLAGKGPETSQVLKEGPVPYSDREAMLSWCEQRGRTIR